MAGGTQLGLPGMGGGGGGGTAARTLSVIATYKDAGLVAGVKQANTELEKLQKGQNAAAKPPAAQAMAGFWNSYTSHVKQAQSAVNQLTAANHQFQAGMSQVGKGIAGLAAPIAATKTGITGLIGGFAGLASAASSAESKEKSFMQSVSQLGIDGTKMIQTMREQSKGMVSEIDLYTRANTGMMLIQKEAFASAGGQVKVMSELLQVAMASARATGRQVDYSFESAINGIARMSPLWLDNLGIGLRLGTVYEDAAKKLGKSADAMSMAEKQTALLNKVLEQGMENVRKFGISSGGIKTQFEILGAQSKDFAYHLGKTFIPVLTGVVKELQTLVVVADKHLVPAFDGIWKAFNRLPQPLKNLLVGFSTLSIAGQALAPIIAQLGDDGGVMSALMKKLPVLGGAVMFATAAFKDSGLLGKWRGELERLDKVATTIKVDRVKAALKALTEIPEGNRTEAEAKQIENLKRVQKAKKVLDEEEEKAARERQNRINRAPVTLDADAGGGRAALESAKRDAKAKAEAITDAESEALLAARAEFAASQKDAGVTWEIVDVQSTKSRLNEVWLGIRDEAGGILAGVGEFLAKDLLGAFFSSMNAGFESSDVYDYFLRLSEAVKDTMAVTGEFIKGFNLAGDVGATGLERIGLAAEFAGQKFPELKSVIAELAGAFETMMTWVNDAKVFWAEHGEQIKQLAAYYLEWKVASVLVLDPLSNVVKGILSMATAIGMAAPGLKMLAGFLGFGGAGAAGAGAAGAGAGGGLAGAGAAASGALGTLGAALAGLTAPVAIAGAAVGAMAVAWYKDFGGIKTQAKAMVEDVKQTFAESKGFIGLFTGGSEATEEVVGRLGQIMAGVGKAYFDWVERLRASQSGKSILGNLLDGATKDREKLKLELKRFADSVSTWWKGFTANTAVRRASVQAAWAMALSGIGAAIESAAPGLLAKAQGLASSIMGVIGGIQDWMNTPLVAGKDGAPLGGYLPGMGPKKPSSGNWSYGPDGALMRDGKKVGKSDGEFSSQRLGEMNLQNSRNERRKAQEKKKKEEEGGFESGGGSDPGAEGAGGGGGGGGGGDGGGGGEGGGGEGKDPVEQAYQTISGISGAIKGAIDAMKAAWSEWRGAAPDRMLDEIFASMQDMAERMIEVAAGFDPLKMETASSAASLISGIASSMGAVVDAYEKLARVRFPSKARLDRLFLEMAELGKFAMKLSGDLLEVGTEGAMKGGGKGSKLETSIQKTEMAKSLGEIITGWAGAMGATVEALDKLSRGRMTGVGRLAKVGELWRSIMDLGRELTTYATDKAGGELTPRTFLEQKDVADGMGTWLKAISDTVDLAGKMFSTRWSSVDTAGPQKILRQVVDLAMALTRDMKAAYGEDFLVQLEDLKGVADALAPWPGLMSTITDVATKLGDVRIGGVDLGVLTEKVFGLGHIARTMTEAFQNAFGSEDFLQRMEDLKLTAEALTPWTTLLGGLSAVLETVAKHAAYTERAVNMTTAPMEGLLLSVMQMGQRLLAASGAAADDPSWQHAQDDAKKLAESVGAMLAPINALSGTLDMMERLSARMQGQGGGLGDQHFDAVGNLMAGLIRAAGGIYTAAMKGLGADWKKSLEQSKAIAETFTSWLAPIVGLSQAVESLRHMATRGDQTATVDSIFGERGLLMAVAKGAWGFVKGVWGRANPVGEQDISKAVASTFGGWVDMLSKLGEMSRSLRRMRDGIDSKVLAEIFGDGSVNANTGKPDGLLADIAWAAWPFVRAVLRTPLAKEAQELSQQIANTFGTWVGLIKSIADMSRGLRLAREIDLTQLDSFEGVLNSIRMLGQKVSAWVRNRADGKEQADGMTAAANALGAMVGLIGSIAGLGRVLRQQIEPSQGEWETATRMVQEVWARAWALTRELIPEANPHGGQRLEDWKEDELPRLTAFGDGMRTAVGIFADIGKLAAGLVRVVEPTVGEWSAAQRMVQEVWKRAQALFQGDPMAGMHPDDIATFSARWKAFWEAAGVAISGFSSAAGLADALSGARMPDVRAGQLDKLRDTLRDVWGLADELFHLLAPELAGPSGDFMRTGEARSRIGAGQAGSAERLKAAAAERMAYMKGFLDVLGPVVSAAGAAADLLTKLASGRELQGMTPGSRKVIGESLRDLFFDLEGIFDEWMGAPAGGEDPARKQQELRQRLEDQKSFLATVAASISGAGGIVDFLTKVHDAAGRLTEVGPSTKALIAATGKSMLELMQGMAESFRYGTWEGKRVVDQAAEFSGQLSQVVGVVGTIADTILKIDNVLWETIDPGTGDPRHTEPGPKGQRARVGSTTRDQLPTRRRRMLEVTREHIAALIDTALMVFRETQKGWEEFKACLVTESGALPNAAEITQEVNVFAQALANVTGAAGGVLQMLQTAVENPLAVLPYHTSMGGKNRDRAITRYYSDFAMAGRNKRAELLAEQLKEGLKRSIRMMVEAVNEAAKEETTRVDPEATKAIALLADAVRSVISMVSEIQAMPDFDLKRIEKLVEAARLLSGVPWGALKGVMSAGHAVVGSAKDYTGGFRPTDWAMDPRNPDNQVFRPQQGPKFGKPGGPIGYEPPNVDVTVEPAEVNVVVYVDGAKVGEADQKQTTLPRPKTPVVSRNGDKRASSRWTGSRNNYRDYIRTMSGA